MFDDFELLASTAKEVYLWYVKMTKQDGSHVMLDSILQVVPNAEKFVYGFDNSFSMINGSTTFGKIEHLPNLKDVLLRYIPDSFNIEDFLKFIKNQKNTRISLEFDAAISEAFKTQLDNLVDTVLKMESYKCWVFYDGQNQEKQKLMGRRFIEWH